ncbi:hypothetical protein [Aeromonas phage AS-zj]|uniref:Uncharacterized protein n=1 Tax=Aeromonas phage AS-zj TaxID=2024208 RepID=A0A223LE08_9CAUD|nr:hypothetical protein HWB28_gp268 [Aeromonas phage AS-zj]ASU00284.1 hypothetical protein [Aeromonas phage AS-zj]
MINAEFKKAVAEFFNTHIEDQKLTFGSFDAKVLCGSFDAKVLWCGKQINDKTPVGRAAIMFAMSKVKV